MNAIAPCARANSHNRIADTLRFGTYQVFFVHQSNAHRVDEGIVLVRRVEDDLSRDGWNAYAVAVVTNPLDDSGKEIAYARILEAAEAERVEHRDRARAHRKDVAQDSADTRCRALVRLHGRWMVVRFDLEGNGETVPNRNDARVFARSLEHVGRSRGKCFQNSTRVLVRAVLAPQSADYSELGESRLASQHPNQPLVLSL